ncbi:DUF928 domain-containing protein [Nodularia sp. UHCC 0506]|uniref:DUF928 domain-containing protein n=1 Tax=Nodularia sp. UHCC 0506 TaxID=3110243 RepID=UPI002B1FF459|nr:DUF928 domain-containing protein [Nodularia sp. UHCC 0506]MEA5516756.1 DUF928 domain-containing protein [Nodularia sp. UHCC 0506]
MNINLKQFSLIFCISLGYLTTASYPSFPQIAPSILLSQNPPENPPRTPPPNKTKPGGGLNPSKQSCNGKNGSLTPLIPVKNPVLTVSAHPTILFYTPDKSEDIEYGEFSIVTQDEKTRVYKKIRFILPNKTPGIVSVSLPQLSEIELVEGQYYHWYLKIYCKGNADSKSKLDVNGWVQRVPFTSEKQKQIESGDSNIWYDSLANLAQKLESSPEDISLRKKWINLLTTIGQEDLSQKPIIGKVVVLED